MPAVAVYDKNFHKEPTIPAALQSGCKALKYEDGDPNAMQCTVGVDSHCFFFYWMDQHRKSYFVDLATLRDTRIGEKRARLPRDSKILQLCWSYAAAGGGERDIPLEEKCLTIVCGGSYVDLRFVSFIFSRRSDAQLWTTTLFALAYNFKTQNLSLERTLLKIYTGIKLSSQPEVRISVKDIIQYFYADKDDRRRCEKTLETHKNDPILLEKFQFKDFLRLYSQIVPRPDLEDVFRVLAIDSGGRYLDEKHLVDFLNKTQRDPRLNEILHPHATTETARVIIQQFEPHEAVRNEGHLSQDGFMRFLFSDASSVISSNNYLQHQDLTHPVSHYFINSSHNTYLLGAQIRGKSTAEMYRQALLAGCRCVELDIWDGEDGEPIVTHGRTMTTHVGIQEVLLAIADYAFKTTDLPLVLSLENRGSAKIQDKLARYLKRAFGGSILDKPLTTHALQSGILLPTPELMKNRILIKNKKKAPAVASLVNQAVRPKVEGEAGDDSIGENSDTDEEGDDPQPDNENMTENNPISPPPPPSSQPDVVEMIETELSALVNYVQPTRFDSFEMAKKRNRAYECVSLVEDRAMMFLKKDPVHFIDFNKRQMSRIYPAPTRVKSTNFLPFFFWSAGCQMVALNFQTADLGMQLNTAMFEYNGRCGYLLKPELMRRKDRTLDPFTESHLDGVVPASLTVRIISGIMLSFKRISTIIEVDMYGIFGDIDKKNHRTRSDGNNGMNPRYDQTHQPFQFRVTMPEMAYLRICVREERTNKLIGHSLLPVNQIRPGYRHIVLRNEIGQVLSATLFVFLEAKDYIPTYQIDLANALENPIKHQSEHDRKEKLEQLMVLAEDAAEESGEEDNEEGGGGEEIMSSQDNGAERLIGNSKSAEENGEKSAVMVVVHKSSPEKLSTPNVSVDKQQHKEAPVARRGSLIPESFEDVAASQRFQDVHAPTVDELKHKVKSIQKLCRKQDKELAKLTDKYEKDLKRLESVQSKEREKLVLEHEKIRSLQEKRKGGGKMSTPILGGRTTSTSTTSASELTEKDLDELIRQQENQRWDLRRRHGEQLGDLRKGHYKMEHELNRRYHETFYRLLDGEMRIQQVALNEQLRSVYDAIVSQVTKRISLETTKELRVLKSHKDVDKMLMDQMCDEVMQKNIRQGVSIRKNYETLYEDRKKTLAEEIDVIAQRILREKTHVGDELDRKFDRECVKLDEDMRKTESFSHNNNDGRGDFKR